MGGFNLSQRVKTRLLYKWIGREGNDTIHLTKIPAPSQVYCPLGGSIVCQKEKRDRAGRSGF